VGRIWQVVTVTDPDGEVAVSQDTIAIDRLFDFPIILAPEPSAVIDVEEGDTVTFTIELAGEGYLDDGLTPFLGVDVLQPSHGAIGIFGSEPQVGDLLRCLIIEWGDWEAHPILFPVTYVAPVGSGVTQVVLEWRACFFIEDFTGGPPQCADSRSVIFNISPK
jgi:hypothetical protein